MKKKKDVSAEAQKSGRIRKILIANRGEIAVRIATAAADMGIGSVSVFPEDDRDSLHVRRSDHAIMIEGKGASAYLDIGRLIAAASEAECDAVHPGYGFLSENAGFAERCAEEGLVFIGPRPETLAVFGDKMKARALATELGIPIVRGTGGDAGIDEIRSFFASAGGSGIMIKAVAGGGGRGMRAVRREEDIEDAYARCRSEALAAFGNGAVYAEELIGRARHIEVQIIGDGTGAVGHLWERECSLQRRHQKLLEVAPAPSLPGAVRRRLIDAAVAIGKSSAYRGAGTVEFLLDCDGDPACENQRFFFMEVNPRLQVEHTVTEELIGFDIVRAQISIASGVSIGGLGLPPADGAPPRGYAVQVRINAESVDTEGGVLAAAGTISAFEPPSGPGVRVDTFGYAGYAINPLYDSLLAKLIVRSSSDEYPDAIRKAYRALCQFRITGVETNIGFLQNLLITPAVMKNDIYIGFVENNMVALAASPSCPHKSLYHEAIPAMNGLSAGPAPQRPGPAGSEPVRAAMAGSIAEISVKKGETVHPGQQILIMDAMKMEHVINAPFGGTVRLIAVKPRDTVQAGQDLLFIEPSGTDSVGEAIEEAPDLNRPRKDLAEVIARHEATLDRARPEAVAKRRKTGQRTARENIEDLCDKDSFIEYGALALAAQRRIKSVQDLIKISPADGLIAGVGSINGADFGDRARAMVLAYDYTVFAGTQGGMNHKKLDRMLHLAGEWKLPIVLFAEGGGGRPSDTDMPWFSALDTTSFAAYASLSGLAPRVGIVSGRCFAGNAALLGCSDVIIATENSNIGMGGPSMIEGGGLGVFSPDEIGPIDVQWSNGVVDVRVEDESEAVAAGRKYLSYFQGDLALWSCADQRRLRFIIPENRKRAYDVRAVIGLLADDGSVLELRAGFGAGYITALARIEGRALGIIANNPLHIGGAIDSEAADKAARFMQLCDGFNIPILSLCDTPGFMVGPDAEMTATVRHVSRMFLVAASLRVPFFTVVLRKGYGLGAQAAAGGHFHVPFFNITWPTGEFGAMSLEGAIKLVLKKQLEAIQDPEERDKLYKGALNMAYEQGKGVNVASVLEIDGVIDPAETRSWVVRGLRSVPGQHEHMGARRRFIDAW